MRHAVRLAWGARPSPNPRVGSVIVRDGRLVAEGFHARAGGDHAEIAALKAAGDAARGATVYVTLEPCNHHGRTPPCTEALIEAGVTRIVVGVPDPNPRVVGGGTARLRAAGIDVVVGVEHDACAALVRSFRKAVTTGLPFVVLKVGMTLDARTATRTGESKWITGPAARADGHALRARADAVLVGIETVLADDPLLTPRHAVIAGPSPARVVLDTHARLPPECNLVRSANEAPVWLVHASDAAPERLALLRSRGVITIEVARLGDRLDPMAALAALAQRGVLEVLVEGGGTVHGALLDAGAADALVCYVAPAILGGDTARAAFGGRGVGALAEARRLASWTFERVGDDLKLQGEFVDVHGHHHRDR